MKKLFITLLFFVCALQVSAQIPPANFVDGVKAPVFISNPKTTAELTAYNFTATDRVLAFDETLDKWMQWNGSAWVNLDAGTLSGLDPSYYLDYTNTTNKPTTIGGYGITDYNSLWDTRLALKSTTDLTEGTNLYYTDARVSANTDVAANTSKTTFPGWGSITNHTDVVSATNTNRFALIANGTTGFVSRLLVKDDISDLPDYLTSFDITTQTDPKYLRSDIADEKTAGDLTFDDNVKIALGTGGAESEISSDGVDTNINLKSGDLNIQNNGVDIITVDRVNGRLGVGTQLPSNNLEVVGDNNDYGFKITRGNATSQYLLFRGYQILSQGNHLLLSADDTKQLRLGHESSSSECVVDIGGNVGIGTLTPSYKLDVTGTGRFTGDVIVPADPYTASWNGDNSVAPKNDVYAEMETKATESSGSFLPTVAPATSGSYTYTRLNCNYTKVGKLIFVTIGFNFSASSSPVGAIEITLNLPGSPTTTGTQYLTIGQFSDFSPTQPSFGQMTPTVSGGKITFTDYEGVTVDDKDLSSAVITMSGVIAID